MNLFVTSSRLKKLVADEIEAERVKTEDKEEDEREKQKAYDELRVYDPKRKCELCGAMPTNVKFCMDGRYGGSSYMWAECTNCSSQSAYRCMIDKKKSKKK